MNPEGGGQRGKKRGQYKLYLLDPSKEIPEATIRSRAKRAAVEQQSLPPQNLEVADEEPRFQPQYPPEDHLNEFEQPLEDACHLETALAAEGCEEETGEVLLQPEIPEHRNVEDEAAVPKQRIDYVEKYHLEKKIHRDFPLSRLDTLLMILHLAVRHCNTQHFVEDQIKFVNALFGSNVLDISYHIYKNLFKSSAEICKHYFCLDCEHYLGSMKDFGKDVKFTKCPKCDKSIDVHSVESGNYFITLSVRQQIEELLRKPNIRIMSRANRDPQVIRDIVDGELYRKLRQPGFPLADENALTVTFNTDGAQVHKSTNNSLWPIQLYINEIVPEQRLRRENLMLAGLWFGQGSPNMSLFLKPFANEILDLSVNGVECIKPDGRVIKCPVFPLTCSVDSVAKPKLLCQKQFNARMGCLYCYHPNDSTIGDETQRYYDQTHNYSIRTEDEVLRDMFQADELQRKNELKTGSVNGLLGISVLTIFLKMVDIFPCSTFSMVWSVVIDYLHAALEGVASDLFNIFENTLTAQQLKVLDDRINKLTVPHDGMTQKPRSFSLRSFWKAKEYRAVILYALPCFENILHARNFSNLKQFAEVLHTLLSDNISTRQLAHAASSLSSFTAGYQRLYGLQNVSYNLHVCRHFIDMVIRFGPLWCYSNFVFESGNGYLVSLVKESKSVINEIAVKHTTIQTASKIILKYTVGQEALKFCGDVLNRTYSKNQDNIDGLLTTGSESVGIVSLEESVLLEEKNVLVSDQKVNFYNRVVINGVIFCSKSYLRSAVYDDSCVMLRNGSYAVIDKIVKKNNSEILCLIKPILIANGSDLIPSIKRCCYYIFGNAKVVFLSDIARKCMLITVEDKSFVSHIPNFYESG